MPPIPSLETIRTGGKVVLARALSLIETAAGDAALARLIDRAAAEPKGLVLGLTGPPGVGKSTLVDALIRRARARDRRVGVIAVDPSSQLTGGALLGDRTRLRTDPADDQVFVRSFAARDRLGGLSDAAIAASLLMRAVNDLTIVESVGVGQSEGDIALVADTVLLLIQPGSGDSLQFMKAGIMELPDLVAVTKADMGDAARRAAADVEGALTLAARDEAPQAAVVLVSAASGEGVDTLFDAIEALGGEIGGAVARRRQAQPHGLVADRIRRRFGSVGLEVAEIEGALARAGGPFAAMNFLERELKRRLLTVFQGYQDDNAPEA
ncbi:MAG: ATP/GTP-binding protein [Ancalomicrobiaceae bacterium]|nr:ATP/GTP-binding protein [Ancalomicrobiaceae bacterium]